MIKKAVRMKLYPGLKKEYAKRHQQLWPEMKEMLKTHGVRSYSIFYDAETDFLFGYLEIEEEERWRQTANTKINRQWWDYMAEMMETNPDHSPITIDLEKVFEL